MKYFIKKDFLKNLKILNKSNWKNIYTDAGNLSNNKTVNTSIYCFSTILIDINLIIEVFTEAIEVKGIEEIFYFNFRVTTIESVNENCKKSFISKFEPIVLFPSDFNLSEFLNVKNEIRILFSYDFEILEEETIAYPIGFYIKNYEGKQLLFSQHNQMPEVYAISLDNQFNLEAMASADKIMTITEILNIPEIDMINNL